MSEVDLGGTADMADMSRVQYELDYTEGISLQMRIPERLKVGPDSAPTQSHVFPMECHSTMMQVPDRIIVAGDETDPHFRSRELDLIQSIPEDSVELKAPPHVLTLQEQPLDFLDLEEGEEEPEPVQLKKEIKCCTRSWQGRETCHNGQIVKYNNLSLSPSAPVHIRPPIVSAEDWPTVESVGGVLSYIQFTTRRAYQHVLAVLDISNRRDAIVRLDADLEGTTDDLALADAPALKRQIVKLNRRLQVLEHEHKERAKRERVVYSLTAAFWLLSAWMCVRR